MTYFIIIYLKYKKYSLILLILSYPVATLFLTTSRNASHGRC